MAETYWIEAVEGALEDAGIEATPEQVKGMAGGITVSHDQYAVAFGYDVADVNLVAARAQEVIELRAELARERAKVACQLCSGCGQLASQGPSHRAEYKCYRCDGAGRHDP